MLFDAMPEIEEKTKKLNNFYKKFDDKFPK